MLVSSSAPSSPPPPPAAARERKKPRRSHNQPPPTDPSFAEDELPEPLDRYAVGAILRLCVTSFLTFDDCTVTPGPWMNMIMGPNGSGKSSLVAAIALGLGAPPTVLGRSKNIEEYIQYGQPFASIETVLKGDSRTGAPWTTIKRLIVRKAGDSDHRPEWTVNGKPATMKLVRDLVQALNINLDNLCQFLPQDKVSEFARLSPSELLRETEKVAAPHAALQAHLRLCELKLEESQLAGEQDTDSRLISSRQEACNNIESIFAAMQAQREHLKTAALCREKILLLDYSQAQADHEQARREWEAAKQELQEADASAGPLKLQIDQLDERIRATTFTVLDKEQAQVLQHQQALASLATQQAEVKRRIEKSRLLVEKKGREQQELARVVSRLQAGLGTPPPVFNPDFMRDELRQSLSFQDSLSQDLIHLDTAVNQMRQQGESVTNDINDARRQLNKLADERERRREHLNRATPDAIKALTWLDADNHRSMFRCAVFGPVALDLHLKKGAPAGAGRAIEGLLSRNVLSAFVFSDMEDQKLFMRKTEQWRVGSILVDMSATSATPPAPQGLGFDCMAVECVEGPEPVLRAVCEQSGLDQTPLALTTGIRDHGKVAHLKRYVSLDSLFTTKVSRYSADDRLVRCVSLRPPVFFTTELADDDQHRVAQLHATINTHNQSLLRNAEAMKPMLARQQDLRAKLERSREEYKRISEARRAKQSEFEEHSAKSRALALRQSECVQLQLAIDAERSNEAAALAEYDALLAQRLQSALHCSALLLDYSDAYHQQAREKGVQVAVDAGAMRRLQGEHQRMLEASQALRSALQEKDAAAKELSQVCKHLLHTLHEQHIGRTLDAPEFAALPDTARELVQREQAERVRAEHMERDCGGVDFARLEREQQERQRELQQLRDRTAAREHQIRELRSTLRTLKGEWLDAVRPLVQAISEAFGALFASMDSVGEVDLQPGALGDEDFAGYELVVRVKFRAEEHLQRLTATRQSGGEKSVATILYLLSLSHVTRHQLHLTPPPFKVVDEINQGMDAVNERRVHRLVLDASLHSGSQYFLITPKLLTGLEYCDQMHVLCVY